MSVELLLRALRGNDWKIVEEAMEGVEAAGLWRDAFLAVDFSPSAVIAEQFHNHWHVRGHRVREQIADDVVMLDALHLLLPTYQGPSMTLFRGENADRFDAGQIGPAWTSKTKVAEMFGRGLQAIGSGGVLLRVYASEAAIISGPSRHSLYLGEAEFTLDTRRLPGVTELTRYRPI